MAFTGSNWGRRVLLTGLTPTATLSGFVALVSLDNVPTEAIDAGSNSALNGGGDLRFSTDDAGVNQLPLEVVSYVTDATPGNRKCQLWIRFPSYSSGARSVYMFYKKAGETQPAVTDTFGRNSVWQDYEFVSHNNDIDSTGNHTVLLNTGSFPGNAQNAWGDTIPCDFGVDVNNVIYASGINYLTSFTFSNWHKQSIGHTGNNASGAYSNGLNDNRITLVNDTNWTNNNGWLLPNAKSTDTWINNNLVWTSATSRVMYENGSHKATDSSITNHAGIDTLVIGSGVLGGGETQDGLIHETRLTPLTLSAEHISSEYSNQSSPATFWTTGTPETPGGGGGELLVVDSGSFALTGTTTPTTAQFNITSETNSYTLSGTLIDLNFAGNTATESGSYTLTGTSIDLRFGSSLIVDSGSYSQTGANVNLTIVAKMTLDVGSYIITGTDINFSDSGNPWTDVSLVSTTWADQTKELTNWTDATAVTTTWTDI